MNNIIYQIAPFMIVRNPETWRWNHARHHTDTIIIGRNPEIVAMRPPALFRIFLNFFGLLDAPKAWALIILNASGKLSAEEASFIPGSEHFKAYRVARIWVAIYSATIIATIFHGSFLPLMIIGFPRFYGA